MFLNRTPIAFMDSEWVKGFQISCGELKIWELTKNNEENSDGRLKGIQHLL